MKRLLWGALLAATGWSPAAAAEKDAPAERTEKAAAAAAMAVYVDVQPECPRPGCWAVTCEAVQRLEGVKSIDVEKTNENLVRVELAGGRLPDPGAWETQFKEYVGTASKFRGVVATLSGALDEVDGALAVNAPEGVKVRLLLANRPLKLGGAANAATAAHAVRARGMLKKLDGGYAVDVEEVSVVKEDAG